MEILLGQWSFNDPHANEISVPVSLGADKRIESGGQGHSGELSGDQRGRRILYVFEGNSSETPASRAPVMKATRSECGRISPAPSSSARRAMRRIIRQASSWSIRRPVLVTKIGPEARPAR